MQENWCDPADPARESTIYDFGKSEGGKGGIG